MIGRVWRLGRIGKKGVKGEEVCVRGGCLRTFIFFSTTKIYLRYQNEEKKRLGRSIILMGLYIRIIHCSVLSPHPSPSPPSPPPPPPSASSCGSILFLESEIMAVWFGMCYVSGVLHIKSTDLKDMLECSRRRRFLSCLCVCFWLSLTLTLCVYLVRILISHSAWCLCLNVCLQIIIIIIIHFSVRRIVCKHQ